MVLHKIISLLAVYEFLKKFLGLIKNSVQIIWMNRAGLNEHIWAVNDVIFKGGLGVMPFRPFL